MKSLIVVGKKKLLFLAILSLFGDFASAEELDRGFCIDETCSRNGYPGVGYDQPLRPQFHFSSKKNWLNDANGMVHDGEKYHLFFQHNPDGTNWGNMTWGIQPVLI